MQTARLKVLVFILIALHLCPVRVWAESVCSNTPIAAPPLRFGTVGYSDTLEIALQELISYLAVDLGAAEYTIYSKPAMLQYRAAIDYVAAEQIDIMFFSPTAYVAYTEKHRDIDVVAFTRTLSDNGEAVEDYTGIILYDPNNVSGDDLSSIDQSIDKPRLAVIAPYSTSGYLFPIDLLERHNLITVNEGWTVDEALSERFEVVKSTSHSDSVDRFFKERGEPDSVDIIFLYQPELAIHLRTEENLVNVEQWLSNRDLECPDPGGDRAVRARNSVLANCMYSERTSPIPNDVIVVREGLGNGKVAEALRTSLERLDRDLQDDAANEELRGALASRKIVGFGGCDRPDLINGRFDKVRDIYQRYKIEENARHTNLSAAEVLEEIAEDIRFKQRLHDQGDVGPQQPYKPKIAVVLSGGGASGAYQAGVLSELAEAFTDIRQDPNWAGIREHLRPHAFIGTSVGSINAVMSAVSVNKEGDWTFIANGRNWLSQFWTNLESGHVLRRGYGDNVFDWRYQLFWVLVRIYKIVAIALLILILIVQTFVAVLVVKRFAKLTFRMQLLCALFLFGLALLRLVWNGSVTDCVLTMLSFMFLVLIIVQAIVAREGFRDKIHWCWFALAWCSFMGTVIIVSPIVNKQVPIIFFWLGSFVIALSLVGGFWLMKPESKTKSVGMRIFSILRGGATVALVIIIPFLVGGLLVDHASLFSEKSFRAKLTGDFERVMGLMPRQPRSGDDRDETKDEYERQRRDRIGKAIYERMMESNSELVITAVDLRHRSEGFQPREVYFASSRTAKRDLSGLGTTLWLDLSRFQEKIIDILTASGAIFPVYPPVKFDSPGKDSNKHFWLVDGGYLHNVPVDAAAGIGATHVLVVRVHPEPAPELPNSSGRRKNPLPANAATANDEPEVLPLFRNLADAFTVLFERAQASDVEAYGEAWTYVIAPKHRKIGLLDFDGCYNGWGMKVHEMIDFLDDGKNSARDPSDDNPGFRRVSVGKIR